MRASESLDGAAGAGGEAGSGSGAGVGAGAIPQRITSGQRYRALIKASTSVVWRADRHGAIMEAWGWSELADQPQLGYLGDGWLEALHPDDRDRATAHWRNAIDRGELAPIEYRIRQSDGSYRWAMARGVALRDLNGEISEWVGTVTDIQERKGAEQALRENEELMRLAVEATGLGIWEMELPSNRTIWSSELKVMAGLPPDVAIDDDRFYNLVHPDDRGPVEEKMIAAVNQLDLNPYNIAYRIYRASDGEERWWHEWSRLVMDSDGRPARIVGAIQDITERKRYEIERHNSEERLRLALQAGRMVAWERNVTTGMTTRSDNAAALFGMMDGPLDDVIARVHPVDRQRFLASVKQVTPKTAITQYRYQHPDGRQLWLESSAMLIEGDGGPRRAVGVTTDITDKKAAEARLRYAASHDGLTGLLNRSALQTLVERALRKGRRTRTSLALLLLDLDHFKDVNDTLGHDAGDLLLKSVADRLRMMLGEAVPVARLGGDEFAIALLQEPDVGNAEAIAAALLRRLAEPFVYRGKRISVKVSVGLARAEEGRPCFLDLLKAADLALYSAKNDGRHRVKAFEPAMQDQVLRRIALAAELREALSAGQVVPFYQPKVDLRDGRIIGFEALARWVHPERGVLTPASFGTAFEDPELTIAIGETMMSHVVRDVAEWLSRGLDCGRVAINLSSHAFKVPEVASQFLAELRAAEVPPGLFAVEVTETVFLDGDANGVGETLRQFREADVLVSLDDFGTGYASLTHLKRFPVDEIKIDRSFVRDLEEDPDDAAIVSAVIGLGRNLGLKVVAEGIETPGQAQKLLAWGCDFGQGYLFSKPMAGSRVPWAIRTRFLASAEEPSLKARRG
jgi:diguanylate cyclase (GGDEF)-like protein/PAS domain S-box-containing protein